MVQPQNLRENAKFATSIASMTPPKSTKIVFGRGSAPDPAGGAHDALPDPLVDRGWGYPIPLRDFGARN